MRKGYIRFSALLLPVLFLSCSDNGPQPASYDELEQRIQIAVTKNNIEELESLFFEMPEQWVKARDISEQVFTALSESGFTTKRVDFLHSPATISQSWSIEPKEFLRIEGTNNQTKQISVGFFLGESKGSTYISYPSNQAAKTSQRSLTYYLVSSPNVDLGERLPATFQSSWSGLDAKSYSMDNLAASLTRLSEVNIVNKTGIEGDYDFSLKLNAAQDPSNIKMDLQSIGLDLIKEEEIQQDGAGQPPTRSEFE